MNLIIQKSGYLQIVTVMIIDIKPVKIKRFLVKSLAAKMYYKSETAKESVTIKITDSFIGGEEVI